MTLREFPDSAGELWEAFAVVPREQERRHYDRRSTELRLEDAEERRDADRRVTVGHTSGRIDSHGWLCFQHGEERRRLMPIPDDWTSCDDARLADYLATAQPVRRLTTHPHRPR